MQGTTSVPAPDVETRSMLPRQSGEPKPGLLPQELLRAVVDASPCAVIASDMNRKVIFFNPAAERLYGWKSDEILGRDVDLLVPSDLVDEYHAHRAQTTASGPPPHVETWRVKKDGVRFPVLTSFAPILNKEGQPAGIVVVTEDITERKKTSEALQDINTALEERVQERTRALEATNRELEAFAYSVSHDLRSPLRAMDGFSQALLEDYGQKMDDTGKNFLVRIRLASQRMGHLIDDLLGLSRLTRGEMTRAPTDMTDLARKAAEEVHQQHPERNVELTIADGMTANCDAHLIGIVLQNLFSNAWKFTGKEPNPKIEMGTTEREGHRAFFVRDNGAGFDMQYVDKLFRPFQRLHSSAEFEGNGIGLATVQRIVHRHGGTVAAEGQPGKGATFFFSID